MLCQLTRTEVAYLSYFTSARVEELRSSVVDRLDWYYALDDREEFRIGRDDHRTSCIEVKPLRGKLHFGQSNPNEYDAKNALIVFDSLRSLTPHQASEERLWCYLSHVDAPDYITQRWLSDRPTSDKMATKKVRNHFFSFGSRGVLRDNGISRLWWLGRIAYDVDPSNPAQFLEIILHRQDVRSALLERPFVSTNRRVLTAIYHVMKEHWNGDKKLFQRSVFRDWMIALNRCGGVILLDGLSPARLLYLLKREANRALDRGGESGLA